MTRLLPRDGIDGANAAPDAAVSDIAQRPEAIFETSHAAPHLDLAACIRRMSAESGRPPLQIVKEFVVLATGPGRLSIGDYIAYRLYDETFCAGLDKSAFIGRRRNQELLSEINYRHEWNCLADDKIANASYMAAYGLPIIPTKAIFAPFRHAGGGCLLRSKEQLRDFLSSPDNFPLFGKPIDGFQSLGSLALDAVDPTTRTITTRKAEVPIDDIVETIAANYSTGYLFQDRLTAHRDVWPAIGRGLSTVRMVTATTDDGPYAFAAGWKIIADGNVADNFWRPGNILAGLEIETGRIEKAVTGSGFDMKDVVRHPDTGATLAGLAPPLWADLMTVALEGHRTLRHVGMIGWDIATTDAGPVIVETNVMPDLSLVQAANRKGAFDKRFVALLARQKAGAAEHKQAMKATIVRDQQSVFARKPARADAA